MTDICAAGAEGPGLAQRVEALVRDHEAEVAELNEKLAKANALIRAKTSEARALKGQIAKLKKMKFGANADRNPSKKMITSDDPTEAVPSQDGEGPVELLSGAKSTGTPRVPRKGSGRGKRIWREHLERREVDMGKNYPETCPCGCGGSRRGYDVKETLEVVPARYFVAVHRYPRFRCRARNKIVGVSFKPQVFPQTTVSHSVMANAVYLRFGAHLPWHRQEGMLRSQGIDLKRSTLMRSSNRLATQALLPIFELMKSELLHNSTRLFMDETTIPMLHPGNGKTKTSYLFALHRDDSSFGGKLPPIVLYFPSETRAMYKIHEILDSVSAIVQTDAYSGYGQLGRAGTPVAGIKSAKCWAHARRYFTNEYEFNKTADAAKVIEMIATLYAEERKTMGMQPSIRVSDRREQCLPMLTRIRAFLAECSARHLGRSGMSKAINYMKKSLARPDAFH